MVWAGAFHTFSCHGQEFLKAKGLEPARHYGLVVNYGLARASLDFGPDSQEVL